MRVHGGLEPWRACVENLLQCQTREDIHGVDGYHPRGHECPYGKRGDPSRWAAINRQDL